MKIETGNNTQITVPGVAQITFSDGDGSVVIDLAGMSQQVVQEGARLTIQMNPRLAFVAPEERGSVAEELGLTPYEYVRLKG